jgi:hypothetical protein
MPHFGKTNACEASAPIANPPMPNLSKSKLIAYRQCAKRLWLEIHRPELRDDTGSEQAFAIGNEVGELARRLFDPAATGVLIDIDDLGWDTAFSRTAELLAAGNGPIFEAALQAEGALALADIMMPGVLGGQSAWRMIEVKSSTSLKDYHRDDVAIQACIAAKAGVRLEAVLIAHINNAFVYPGDGDYQGIFTLVDLTAECALRAGEVAEWIGAAQAVATLQDEPVIDTGRHCEAPFTCGFRAYCNRNIAVPEHPPNILPYLREPRLAHWKSQGITELHQTPDDELSWKQQRVKTATLDGTVFFDAQGAAGALAGHGLPARFLDFETVQFAIPVWKGTRPYEQTPFQFSLHTVDPAGDLRHREFLDPSGADPRPQLVSALVDCCGADGPIFAYNAAFEKRVIATLAVQFPRFQQELDAIHARIVDLMPIARDYYYHPSQQGSWSLKAVFPAICPGSGHDQLDGVHDGTEAGLAYREAIHPATDPERRHTLGKQLLDYCRLDTLATVEIWRFFRGNDL